MVRTTSGELHHYGSALRHLAEAGYGGTVGVVTPFRQQMIRLKDTLEAVGALPREFIERTDLHIDTAYGFQGGERDLILFSLCGGPDVTPGGVWFFREDKNQFNVAVSRARAVLHIVGNRDWALASGFPHLEKLASRTLPGWSSSTRSEREPQSPWQSPSPSSTGRWRPPDRARWPQGRRLLEGPPTPKTRVEGASLLGLRIARENGKVRRASEGRPQ